MARKARTTGVDAESYKFTREEATRKNIPEAGLVKGAIDEDAFAAFRTLVSLHFKPGTSLGMDSGEGRLQVKVIDQRGNAVVKTVRV